jgi:hypothetical protein
MAIYGECEVRGNFVPVTITELGQSGCALSSASNAQLPNGELALWIGAIGPLAASAMQVDASHAHAEFKDLLDLRIISHFTH